MGIWARIAERFKKTEVIARIIPTYQASRKLPLPHDFRNLADEGYRKNVVIHACVRVLMRTGAEVDIRVRRQNGKGELSPVALNDPLLKLLKRPNPEQSTYEWLEQLALHYHVTGNSFTHKVRSSRGQVVELWQLRPDRTRVKPGLGGFVEGYRFPVGSDPQKERPVPFEDVIHMRMPDPLDDYYGLSPIAVLARVGDLDNHAIDYLRAFFQNNGIPGGLLKVKEIVNKEKADAIKQRWTDQYGKGEYSGKSGWHSIGLIDANAEYQEIGTQPNKLNLAAIFGETESRICAAFGVPPIIVAVWIGLMRSTYANYKFAMKDLWVDQVSPQYKRIGDKLTAELAPEFGNNYVIDFDFSHVEALQEDRAELRKYGLEGWNGGLLTRNQALELGGLDPIQGAEGEERKQVGGGGMAFSRTFFAEAAPRAQLSVGDEIPVGKAPPDPEWKALHRAADEKLRAMIRAFLRAVKETRKAVDVEAIHKALKVGDMVGAEDAIPWDSLAIGKLSDLYPEHLKAIFSKAASLTRIPEKRADAIGPREHHVVTVPPETAEAWAQQRVAELIREVSETTKAAVRQIIDRCFTEGLKTLRAAKQIRDMVGLTARQELSVKNYRLGLIKDGLSLDAADRRALRRMARLLRKRALTIARTEGIRAGSAGQHELFQEAARQRIIDAIKSRRVWVVTPDDKACKKCLALDGKSVGLNEEFAPGIMFPPLEPNCRCAVAIEQ